jgi:hypothetical protein
MMQAGHPVLAAMSTSTVLPEGESDAVLCVTGAKMRQQK